MSKIFRYKFICGLAVTVFVYFSLGCFAFGSDFSPGRLGKANEEDANWKNWLDKYIRGVLYIGMPVNEFLKNFTKDGSWTDSERPYIIGNEDNNYIIVGRKNLKYKVIFKDNLLEKLEQYTYDKIPIVTAHYENVPFYLKGEKIIDGLYQGMSEEDFLNTFSDKILMKFEKGYLISTNDKHKLGIKFTNSILTHSWITD